MTISSKTARGTASSSYFFEHCNIKKEMSMYCHDCIAFKNSLIKEPFPAMPSYVGVFEEQYNLGVSSNALRRRLIKDFDCAMTLFQ